MRITKNQLKQIIKEELQTVVEDCWDGYERVEGSVEGAPGSCRKKGSVNEEETGLEPKIRKVLKDEGGAAGLDAIVKGTDASEDEVKAALKAMVDVGLHRNGDYILDDESEIDVKKKLNDGPSLNTMQQEGKICDKGISYVIRTDPGGKDIKRGEDGKLKNWSARAAQIASKYCKDPDYGKGRGKDAKDESIEEAEGGLKAWEKENWVHSDGRPCGSGDKDGSKSRCKPASKWKTMSKKEKKADDAKKRAGTKKGKQHVKSNYPVTKKHTKREGLSMNRQRLMEIIKEELGTAFVEEYQMIEASYDDGSPLSEDFEFYESLDEQQLEEAVYQGKTVKLNKPTRGDVKKFKVYVNSGKKDKKGRIKAKKVNFGDKKMRIKKSNPKRRKSFRARHNCANPGPKTKARYWSCKKW